MTASRVVHHADALVWLREHDLRSCSIITSLPDVSEVPSLGPEGWREFFVESASLVAQKTSPEGLAIFFQTDVKHDGVWIDKASLVDAGVQRWGLTRVFHRIVLRVPAGAVTHARAGYSHLVAYSREARLDLARPGPDVIPEAGPTTWTRGMGLHACRAACEAVLRFTPTRTVVDPFCGHGTVLAVANSMGLDAIGIELGAKRARRAQRLQLEELSALGGCPGDVAP